MVRDGHRLLIFTELDIPLFGGGLWIDQLE